MNGTHTPEVRARREDIGALDQRIRHDHVVGSGDPLDQQHADGAQEVGLVVDVDVVAGDLRVRRVGPVERERQRHRGPADRRQQCGRRRNRRGVRDLDAQRRRREAAHAARRHRHDAVEGVERVAPSGAEARPELQRVERQRQRVREGRLIVGFQQVVMGARHGGPVDEEELAHVELRGAGGRGETGCSGRGPEPDDGEAPYRPGRIQREDRSADDLGGLDAPEVGPVRQTADGGLCAGRTAVGGRIREPRRDDEGEGRSGRHLPRIAPDRPIRIHDGAPCERDRLHQGRPGTRLEQDRRRRCRLSIRRECERGERNANRGEDGSGLLHLLHLLNAFVLSNWADLRRAFVTVALGLACPSRFVRGTFHPAAPCGCQRELRNLWVSP